MKFLNDLGIFFYYAQPMPGAEAYPWIERIDEQTGKQPNTVLPKPKENFFLHGGFPKSTVKKRIWYQAKFYHLLSIWLYLGLSCDPQIVPNRSLPFKSLCINTFQL